MKQLGHLLTLTYRNWSSHHADRMGAALACYTLLSLAPLVMLAISIGSLFLWDTQLERYLHQEVSDLAGSNVADMVRGLASQARKPSSGTFASIIGLVTLLFGASGVFAELRSALNAMWDITPLNTEGVWGFIRAKIFSMGMVLAVGFLLIVSLVISTVLSALGKYFGGFMPLPPAVLELLNFIISLAGITGMFALILRYVPDSKIDWREIWAGALLSSILFTAGKYAIGLYLGRTAVSSVYGASGSAVAITLWVYYSAQLFFFGAEFTKVYAQTRKGELQAPNDHVPHGQQLRTSPH